MTYALDLVIHAVRFDLIGALVTRLLRERWRQNAASGDTIKV
jgi:hypothetical protein